MPMTMLLSPFFPAKIQSGVGIGASRTGGAVTIKQDWSNVQNGIAPPDDVEVLARDPSDGQFYRTTPDGLADLIRPVASQPEAEAGSNNTKTMTPLRSKQSITANAEGANYTPQDPDAALGSIRQELLETVRVDRFWRALDADWTNAINRGVAHLRAGNGGVLEFGKRAYEHSAMISVNMTKPVIFRGQGRGVTILRQTNSAQGGLYFYHATLQAQGSSGVANMTIEAGAGWDTSGFQGTGSSGCGLRVDYAGDNFSTYGISIHNYAFGLRVEASWNNVFFDGRVLYAQSAAIMIGGDTSLPSAGGNKFIAWKPSNNGFSGDNSLSAGLRIRQSGGDFFSAMDITSFKNGVVVDPPSGKQVAYCFFSQVLSDTSTSDGWRFDATDGGIYRIKTSDCWGSFSGASGLVTTGANLDGLDLMGFTAAENGLQGARFNTGKRISWHGGGAARNSQSADLTYSGIYVGATVDGCRLNTVSGNYASGLTNQQTAGLEIANGALNVNWSGCDFPAPGTVPVQNGSSSSSNYGIGCTPIMAGANRNAAAVFSSVTTATVAAGSTVYLGCHGSSAASGLSVWMPGRVGTITQILIAVETPPGAAQSFTYELYVNAVATGLTAIISGAASYVAVATSPLVPVSPTDTINIRLVTSAGAAASNHRYTINMDA